MKKLGLLVMPLMAVSLLTNCGNNTPQTVEHVVTFESNGGSHIETQKVKDGETATEPDPKPTKTDYIFEGWYTNNDLSNDAYNFSTPVTSDLTLYAKWNGGYHTLTFNGTNCSMYDILKPDEAITSKQVSAGQTATFKIKNDENYALPASNQVTFTNPDGEPIESAKYNENSGNSPLRWIVM